MTTTRRLSEFDQLFLNLIDELAELFPNCKETLEIQKDLRSNPNQLDAIKIDWARLIVPYNILSHRPTARYFELVANDLPDHLFNRLQLCARYKSMKGDKMAQDALRGLLADLEIHALRDDDTASPVVVEPPESDIKTKSRFDDPALHELCVQRLGNAELVNQLRQLCRDIPLLNDIYKHSSNAEIADQMVRMKKMLPLFLRMFASGTPIGDVIKHFKTAS